MLALIATVALADNCPDNYVSTLQVTAYNNYTWCVDGGAAKQYPWIAFDQLNETELCTPARDEYQCCLAFWFSTNLENFIQCYANFDAATGYEFTTELPAAGITCSNTLQTAIVSSNNAQNGIAAINCLSATSTSTTTTVDGSTTTTAVDICAGSCGTGAGPCRLNSPMFGIVCTEVDDEFFLTCEAMNYVDCSATTTTTHTAATTTESPSSTLSADTIVGISVGAAAGAGLVYGVISACT